MTNQLTRLENVKNRTILVQDTDIKYNDSILVISEARAERERAAQNAVTRVGARQAQAITTMLEKMNNQECEFPGLAYDKTESCTKSAEQSDKYCKRHRRILDDAWDNQVDLSHIPNFKPLPAIPQRKRSSSIIDDPAEIQKRIKTPEEIVNSPDVRRKGQFTMARRLKHQCGTECHSGYDHAYEPVSCEICGQETESPHALACLHFFCLNCIVQQSETYNRCPQCSYRFKHIYDFSSGALTLTVENIDPPAQVWSSIRATFGSRYFG